MAHPLPSAGAPESTGPVYNTLSQEAITVVLTELNAFFKDYDCVKTDFTPATVPGDPTSEIYEQKLFISYTSPEDDRFLPALVVKIGGFKEYRMDVGNVWDNLPDGAKRYGGSVTATVSVTIASLSSLDLDRLTDYLQLFFLLIKVPDLQRQGILLVPNSISVNDMGPLTYTTDRSILRNQLSVDVWLQWFMTVPDTNPTVTNVALRLQTPSSFATSGVAEKE